ncbi:STIV orfB116 family protein [Blautia producta]|uniref:STIV orfB116 family protein n=1 Tax=Blautia producta TaxID=33035 RepID=UPI0031B62E9B
MGKLALLNTSILTTAGAYRLIDITLDDARRIVSDHAGNLDSAIGHQSTAEIMTTLLGTEIPVNRQMFTQEVGQAARSTTWTSLVRCVTRIALERLNNDGVIRLDVEFA